MQSEDALDARVWLQRLEAEPVWTELLRAAMHSTRCRACELVLLIGASEDFPKSAEQGPRVQGFLVRVGRIVEVARTLPFAYCSSMVPSVRRKHPEYAHAVLLAPPFYAETLRFRVPSAEIEARPDGEA